MEIPKILEARNNGETYCQRIVGTKKEVDRAADLWKNHADLLQRITDYGILEYCEDNEFTKENYNTFKYAISYIGATLAKCAAESKLSNTHANKTL